MPSPVLISKDLRKLLQFGSGVGIVIGAKDLDVVAARVRPSRTRVLGRLTIGNFAERPAAEWGAEYSRFLKLLGAGHLSAAVLLPRGETVVRQVSFPGVAAKDMEGAIRLQVDALHPYGAEEVQWGWSLLAPGSALVGVARRSTVDRYVQLFTEAGILVSNFTFPASAIHAAVRLDGIAGRADGFVALGRSAADAVEAYGESPQRPVFSAEFHLPPERAAALALSELRLPPETVPQPLEEVLPKPEPGPAAKDLSRNALAYATALAGACPRLAPSANVLPPEQRRFSSRAMFIPTATLAVLLLAALGTGVVYSRVAQRDYLARLNAEISRLQPSVARAAALDRETDHAHARAAWLDQFRARTRQDLDVLNQLTNLIAPPAWTNTVDITRDTTRFQGEAPQAAPLWKIIDGSRLFKASKLDSATPNSNGGENFVITGTREGGK